MITNVKTLNITNFHQTISAETQPTTVVFYADKCHICDNLLHHYEKASEYNEGRMRFYKVSFHENRTLAAQLKINKFPTVIFFHEGKETCNRLIGNILFQELQTAIETMIGKKCGTERREIVKADLLIIGAGPAGLTAGIYASRSKLYTVIVDASITGGQVANTYHIANYPGTNGVINGIELVENMKNQAIEFGAHIDEFQGITEVNFSGEEKFVRSQNNDYYAKSVIIATGADPRRLPIQNESEFRGKGIHYCATCDGAFYQDANIIVVGGGVSAMEESLFLTRYAKHVTIVNRKDAFRGPKLYIDEVLHHPKISVAFNSAIHEVHGEEFVNRVVLRNTKDNTLTEMPIDGIFVYIGLLPNTTVFESAITLTSDGYIEAEDGFSTNVPGIFVAGDVRNKSVRQISTAVGDGTVAAIAAEKFLSS